MKIKYLFLIIIITIIIGISSISTFTISENEFVILTRFGKPVRTIKESGLYFKLPGFFETVNRFDRRIHFFTTQPVQYLLGDKNPIVLTCYVCWRVFNPLLFFESLINYDIARQKLGDMVNSQLGNTLGDFNIGNVINTNADEVKLSKIEDQILQNTDSKTKDKYGIEIIQLGIQKIEYPSIVAKAVYNRMRSEREKEAMKYREEGKEEASIIKAKADREVVEIMAKAYKEAEIIKGEGDKKAMQIFSQAYEKDQQFFEFMKSMEVYKEILNEKSTLVLSTDSYLLKYLNDPQGIEKK